jgi:hypothetical protein
MLFSVFLHPARLPRDKELSCQAITHPGSSLVGLSSIPRLVRSSFRRCTGEYSPHLLHANLTSSCSPPSSTALRGGCDDQRTPHDKAEKMKGQAFEHTFERSVWSLERTCTLGEDDGRRALTQRWSGQMLGVQRARDVGRVMRPFREKWRRSKCRRTLVRKGSGLPSQFPAFNRRVKTCDR